MSSMSNSSNFSLWILQIIIAFNLLCFMIFLSYVFNLLNALKDLSASHERACDTISNFIGFEFLEKILLLRYNNVYRHSFTIFYNVVQIHVHFFKTFFITYNFGNQIFFT